jgi:hypothetical protein
MRAAKFELLRFDELQAHQFGVESCRSVMAFAKPKFCRAQPEDQRSAAASSLVRFRSMYASIVPGDSPTRQRARSF